MIDTTETKQIDEAVEEQRTILEENIDDATRHYRTKRVNSDEATQDDKDFYVKNNTAWKLDNIKNTLTSKNKADITKID